MSAAQGGVLFQEKVSRLLSRKNGKPALKPNRPLVLKDAVANRKPKKGEATCITEMSVLMACWKQQNFVDALCSSEISSFYTCVQEAQAAARNKSEQTSFEGGRLPPKQANTLLKRYPNLRSEI
ncbi:coiled-coil-helix-coiled-coil-helix domain-containing protein 1 [Solea solea]|uniref:coiled-coil-helix-coiled-coil-helix domain-containing protein 1 n=1 Tax=Solea solea TaxID=90069 RepID=UPI00272CAF16|nr:coiled-coil-helix-coiled-coil-helix domain-containing protein 1 [Solea solea]